jgi:hypothetical protein
LQPPFEIRQPATKALRQPENMNGELSVEDAEQPTRADLSHVERILRRAPQLKFRLHSRCSRSSERIFPAMADLRQTEGGSR